jgi:serine protease Do
MNASTRVSASLRDSLDGLVRQVRPSLVVVSGHRFGVGAGIVWAAEGLILTNAHVVTHRSLNVMLDDNREFEARLVARDSEVDLALLEIDARDLPAMRAAEALPRVGEMVFTFGHPWGQRGYVSGGIVSALGTARTRGRRGSLAVIRTDAPLAPGNSGGPLVNGAGELVGINAMIVGGDQSIAIPVTVAREFVQAALGDRQPGSPVMEAAV